MFSVLISEKGGEERREVFTGSEVSVGRVRGNDLVLAKGNVSKRHARLTQKDGRFVVVDHNSTNGTYVNRQRIVQATIVREGDRIYVGDFVLRIEGQGDRRSLELVANSPSEGTTGNVDGWEEPSERDLIQPAVPPPPRVPAVLTSSAHLPPGEPPGSNPSGAPRTEAGIPRVEFTAVESIRGLVERVADRVERRTLDRDIPESAARRIEGVLVDELSRQRSEPGLCTTVPEEKLLQMARDELVGFGPLEALIKNPAAVQLTANGTASASMLMQNGDSETLTPFSCPESLDRVVARLSRLGNVSHDGRETFLSGRLDREVIWKAVRRSAAPEGIVIAMRRQVPAESSIEDLVRDGTISRSIATFFAQCTEARANIVVVGSKPSSVARIVSAIASSAGLRPLIILEQHNRLACNVTDAVRLDSSVVSLDPLRLVEFAEALPHAVPVVENLVGVNLPAVMETLGRGLSGLVAGVYAVHSESGIDRLASCLALKCPGTTIQAANLTVSSYLNVCVEVCSPADGRDRVRRISEVSCGEGGQPLLSDLFVFSVERTAAGGAVEGAFYATGTEPKLLERLKTLGMAVDLSPYKRPSSSSGKQPEAV